MAAFDTNSMGLVGDVLELQANMKIAWHIKDFFSLSQEANLYYSSPKFHFYGASWQLIICPNAHTGDKSDGFISLYIKRMSSGIAVTMDVSFCFSLKILDEEILPSLKFKNSFHGKDDGTGYSKVILRSHLMEKLTDQTDSKALFVICTLTHCHPSSVAGSLFTRHQELCDNLKEMYDKGKRADCTLNVDGCDFPTHRLILESRSPVFAAKFAHDMTETEMGKISIGDMDKCTLESILMYMYSGDIDYPTQENVLHLYEAAEKYSIKYLKPICVDFVEKNLSVDWLFDVIKFNVLFQDKDLDRSVKEYFYDNVRQILDTEKFKIFSRENPDFSIELLSTAVKIYAPK